MQKPAGAVFAALAFIIIIKDFPCAEIAIFVLLPENGPPIFRRAYVIHFLQFIGFFRAKQLDHIRRKWVPPKLKKSFFDNFGRDKRRRQRWFWWRRGEIKIVAAGIWVSQITARVNAFAPPIFFGISKGLPIGRRDVRLKCFFPAAGAGYMLAAFLQLPLKGPHLYRILGLKNQILQSYCSGNCSRAPEKPSSFFRLIVFWLALCRRTIRGRFLRRQNRCPRVFLQVS